MTSPLILVQEPATRLHLFQYSDAHGRFLSRSNFTKKEQNNGLDRLLGRVRSLRETGERVLVLDTGDSIQGSPLVDLHDYSSPVSQGMHHPLAVLHKALGVEIFVPGNHEFNFGLDHLAQVQSECPSLWLAGNIHQKDGQPYLPASCVLDYGHFKVGVLGLITEFVPKWENKSFIKGLRFENAFLAAQRELEILRPLCDFLILAYHGGMERHPETGVAWSHNQDGENRGHQFWANFTQVDLLLTGHQHKRLCYGGDPERAWVAQPESYGKCWTHLVLEAKAGAKGKALIAQAPHLEQASDYAPDGLLAKKLKSQIKMLDHLLETPVGKADPSFQVSDPMSQVWTKKHPLIQWINNLLMQATGVDIAACSFLDKDLQGLPEEVTIGDLLRCYFFQDTFCVVKVTGQILCQALEQLASFFILVQKDGKNSLAINPDWSEIRIKSYNYDIFDGIEYALDITKPMGQRLVKLLYHGQEVQPEQELLIALTTYRAGGAFFHMFNPEQIQLEFPAKITDLMTHDLKAQKELKVTPVQNFQILY